MDFDSERNEREDLDIAVIGMAGRFSGAKTPEAFWSNIRDGVESITFFTDEELQASHVAPEVLKNPAIIKAASYLDGIDLFDASFFEYSPREAALIDPQHRLSLEAAWEALEHAGYDPDTYAGLIGVYAGVGTNLYIRDLLLADRQQGSFDGLQLTLGNEKDYFATRISYKLNLRGPSLCVQSACSTSLVAVHLACQGLLDYECDMALAGGVSIRAPQPKYYRYVEGSILSPDGHCRAFDEQGQGTIFGNGLGLVVLKRLKDALQDGDHIYALIKGSAVNNDGNDKVGYTAPGLQGQIEVVQSALATAGVNADTITYIEAHGTGTPLGDPLEINALKHAFKDIPSSHRCAIGSVKTNVGHLDAASGIAGFMKTVLALQHKQLPPTLHFHRPNPQIDFENSPFFVNERLRDWRVENLPRRAGVSSFGMGGTNAHMILEEAPRQAEEESARPCQSLLLSAKTPEALQRATANMLAYLKQEQSIPFADIAYTSQIGRKAFQYRKAIVCRDRQSALTALEQADAECVLEGEAEVRRPDVIFLFSGQGSQYVNMAVELYSSEEVFKTTIDQCASLLEPHLGFDLRKVLYPAADNLSSMGTEIDQTYLAQPALFVIEYALARLLMSWGIEPQAMIGHSIGEYVAACLAGVFSLEDGLFLVAKRGALMQRCQPGAMLAVALSESDLTPLLAPTLSLAAVNAPALCVVSGSFSAIEELHAQLSERAISSHKLHTSHAFHSWMMEDIVEEFEAIVTQVELHAPHIPSISNVTGTWIQDNEATSASYWTRQLRQTVRFQQGMQEFVNRPNALFIEVGPGQTLSKLVRQQPGERKRALIVSTLQGIHGQQSAHEFLQKSIARLWLAGGQVKWAKMYVNEKRYRTALPTYPFERQSHWLPDAQEQLSQRGDSQQQQDDPSVKHAYIPLWKQTFPPFLTTRQEKPTERQSVLLFVALDDEERLTRSIRDHLLSCNYEVIRVTPGQEFAEVGASSYTVNPHNSADYNLLIKHIWQHHAPCRDIIHLWNIQDKQESEEEQRYSGFYSLLFLAQALSNAGNMEDICLLLVANGLYAVTGEEILQPEKATLPGPCRVLPLEFPEITCQCIDILLPQTLEQERWLTRQLVGELQARCPEKVVAYRGRSRWIQTFEPVTAQAASLALPGFRKRGVYALTGGLGGLALGLASQLASTYQARIALISRTPLPPREDWRQWLASHEAQENTAVRIRKVLQIEQAGGEVLLLAADVTNQEQVQQAIDTVYQHFGELHGVLHLAGVSGSGLIQLKTRELAESVLAPKVRGASVLARVLDKRPLDFLVFFSSLTAITGGIGQVDYCAANAFLGTFAAARNAPDGTRVITIDWDAWQWDSWQEKALHILPELQTQLRKLRAEQGISFEEGAALLQEILQLPFSQVLVSAQNIQAAIDTHAKFSRAFWSGQLAQAQAAPSRPSLTKLKTEYLAPENEIERTLALLWQDALGIEQIGVHDDFIELGGHSLMAIQLVARIRETFQINLPLSSFFEQNTIAKLASMIIANQSGDIDIDYEDLDRLLEEIEGLSEEEVNRRLAEEE